MIDDIAKFFIRFLEKHADDLMRGTSQLWDNFLVRVAGIRIFRYFFDESIVDKPILKDWAILSAIWIVIIVSLLVVLIRRRISRQRTRSWDGS